MAINDRDFYASHGISFDIEEMQIEYTKRVIRQAKIEVLTELQLEIEETEIGNKDKYSVLILQGVDLGKKLSKALIQHKINSLEEEK